MLQAGLKAAGIQTNFSLFDDGLVVFKDELDGVFEGDDVLFEVGVDVLNHRRQRRGLAGSGGARHENDAARGSCNRLDDRHET